MALVPLIAAPAIASKGAFLASMAGKLASPLLLKYGSKGAIAAGSRLAPHAEEALGRILDDPRTAQGMSNISNILSSKVKNIMNNVFGAHRGKTARQFFAKFGRGAKTVTDAVLSDTGRQVLQGGLDIAKDLDIINQSQADKALQIHKVAMKGHDALSRFNSLSKDELSPRMDYQNRTDPNPGSAPMRDAIVQLRQPPPMPARDHAPYVAPNYNEYVKPYDESNQGSAPVYFPYTPRNLQKDMAPTPEGYRPATSYIKRNKRV